MTELLIVSKPRGRIFKWIGGGVYKSYKDPVSKSVSDSVGDLIVSGDNPEEVIVDDSGIWESHTTPDKQNLAVEKVRVWLKRYGSPSGSIKVELWNEDGTTKIAGIGSIDASEITTDTYGEYYDLAPSSTIQLDPNTAYRVKVWHDGTYDRDNKIVGKYYTDTGRYRIDLYLKFFIQGAELEISLDFLYSGTAVKRLQESLSKTSVTIADVRVNGVSVGASLEKEDEIPQADNYTVTYVYDVDASNYSLSASIQRYLYYNKTSITLDDLDVSETYLQEIEFGGDGGVLRIDDNPDSDLVGSAGEKIQFTDILVPFRKLEWISGGGEVLILGVE